MRIPDLVDGAVSPVEAVLDAISMQAHDTPTLPVLLTYAPVAQMNPFQRLLYARSADHGFAVVPTLSFHDLGRVSWGGRSVIHLHWLASILDGVSTHDAARLRIDAFRSDLARWRAAGNRIVWSMHNVLPHDSDLPDAQVALRQAIVDAADAIHILSESSADEARRYYDLPEEKLFHVPHPSYEGWYANVGDRATARLDIGVEPSDFVFLLFGSIQPYKGVLELVDAFEALRNRCPGRALKLVISGKPVDKPYLAEVAERISRVDDALLVPSAMEERNIQSLFNGADVVVAPYKRTLNSGVALLAATFRKPLVAPRAGGVLETYRGDPTLLYGDVPGDRLEDALQRSLEHRIAPGVFDEILARHRPAAASDRFFRALREKFFAPAKTSGTNR